MGYKTQYMFYKKQKKSIDAGERSVWNLEIEVQNLKEMNKKLLIENNNTPNSFGDVHSFY